MHHSAVKAILQTPDPSSKHARWWTRVYGSGVKSVKIVHRPGKCNSNANVLSCSPQMPALSESFAHGELQVLFLQSSPEEIESLLCAELDQDRSLDSFTE